ncbi:MAG: glycosyltransferase [Proteobacteria bacterium]|nr:glycosyltransferase [Pseudomonadota bacterium]
MAKNKESPDKPFILHVITDLGTGGAETMVTEIVLRKHRDGEFPVIASLIDGGSQFKRLQAAGCDVVGLGMRRGRPGVLALFRLARLIRDRRPAIIQSWMYHADLAALVALWLSGRRRDTNFFWGVRCSDMDQARYGVLFRIVLRLCAWLSRAPDGIIANSHAGLDLHLSLGYRPKRAAVVQNGFDAERFRFDPGPRKRIRQTLGIDEEQFVIGTVARVDAMKDYPTLLAAIGRLEGVTALAVGKGTEALPETEGLVGLGERSDVADILSAIDVLVSASAFGEGLSNVIGEAMATGRPIVATDVGDAAQLVGDGGIIVPPGRPDLLADAVRRLRGDRDLCVKMGISGRHRIEQEFLLSHAINRFDEAYGYRREI